MRKTSFIIFTVMLLVAMTTTSPVAQARVQNFGDCPPTRLASISIVNQGQLNVGQTVIAMIYVPVEKTGDLLLTEENGKETKLDLISAETEMGIEKCWRKFLATVKIETKGPHALILKENGEIIAEKTFYVR